MESDIVQQQVISDNETVVFPPEHASPLIKKHISDNCKVVEDLLMLANEIDGWTIEGVNSEVTIARKILADSPIHIIRGTGNVKSSIESIWEDFQSYENLKKWDKLFYATEQFEKVVHSNKVELYSIDYLAYRSPTFLVASRDFCVFSASKRIGDKIVVTAYSVNYNNCSDRTSYVRGELKTSGSIVEKIDDNTVKLTYLVQIDPKGLLPTFVVNWVATEQALNVHYMRQHFEGKASAEAR